MLQTSKTKTVLIYVSKYKKADKLSKHYLLSFPFFFYFFFFFSPFFFFFFPFSYLFCNCFWKFFCVLSNVSLKEGKRSRTSQSDSKKQNKTKKSWKQNSDFRGRRKMMKKKKIKSKIKQRFSKQSQLAAEYSPLCEPKNPTPAGNEQQGWHFQQDKQPQLHDFLL